MAEKQAAITITEREDFVRHLKGFLNRERKLALLLDFDGTLSPIVERPEEAKMPTDVEQNLKRLVNNPQVFVAIISGRGLEDVKARAGISKITYSGNHGIEIENANGVRSDFELEESVKDKYRRILKEMNEKVAHHGAWVEDKQFSLTLHFRSTPTEFVESVKTEATDIIKFHGWIAENAHCAVEGKPPIIWNKGEAAKYILKKNFGDNWQTDVKVIFAGDDTTDEDVMKALQGIGKSFRISQSPDIQTYADFRLPSIKQISVLLECLVNIYS